MMIQKHVPLRLWDFVMKHEVELLNRMWNPKTLRTPKEQLTGNIPNYLISRSTLILAFTTAYGNGTLTTSLLVSDVGLPLPQPGAGLCLIGFFLILANLLFALLFSMSPRMRLVS